MIPRFRLSFIFPGSILLLFSIILVACQASSSPLFTPSPLPPVPLSTSSSPSPSRTLWPSPTPFPTSALNPPLTPTIDRLAEPPLPPNPTQLEKGRHLFWLNCMTCHGEKGQGLTDEFRSLYVEEANCWGRGCHGGRSEDQGFPIPTVVPAIISSKGNIRPFKTPKELFEYLRLTHPPQNPGFMPDEDYWALTAYLLDQNGRLPAGQVLGP
jgi:mono/diheme cytochrome c family protein